MPGHVEPDPGNRSAGVDIDAVIERLGASVIDVLRPDTTAVRRIRSIGHDSRDLEPGSMFACLRGARFDGHDHADAAIAAGAVALLVDHRLAGVGVTQLVVDDTRRRLGPISSLIHGDPSTKMTTVGVTGTNGKTTVTAMVASIFEGVGWITGRIGTLHGPRTTPEAPELQATLAGFVADGADAAVLEVSSHALALHRVDGTSFDAVVFTNLGHDHLDLHETPEQYFRAKARLFDPSFAPCAVINADDPHGQLLTDTLESEAMRVVSFSLDDADELVVTASTSRFRWRGVGVDVPLGGRFNVLNALAALTVSVELGIDPTDAAEALRSMPRIPGRFETVIAPPDAAFTVVVDYAHTPDGLAEVIRATRSAIDAESKVIAVFGCGGNRDQDKRAPMGAAAAMLADRVVLTSDNPRTEDPDSIIGDILGGVPDEYRSRVMTFVDRRTAIRRGLESAEAGDVVIVAGKGHETTQDLGDRVIEFDDCAVVLDVIGELA